MSDTIRKVRFSDVNVGDKLFMHYDTVYPYAPVTVKEKMLNGDGKPCLSLYWEETGGTSFATEEYFDRLFWTMEDAKTYLQNLEDGIKANYYNNVKTLDDLIQFAIDHIDEEYCPVAREFIGEFYEKWKEEKAIGKPVKKEAFSQEK